MAVRQRMMRRQELRHDAFVRIPRLSGYYYQASFIITADQTRNRNRRRKSVSGTPAWATLAGGLKLRMTMIPLLNKNTAARVAFGACRGEKRCRGVSGGPPNQSYILPIGITGIVCAENISSMHRRFYGIFLPHRGERMKKSHRRESCRCDVWIFYQDTVLFQRYEEKNRVLWNSYIFPLYLWDKPDQS